MFYYEVTQACDLACQHCRASAQPIADPHQLTPVQSRALLDQVASFPRPPVVVFTGGDPLKRADLLDLIRYARDKGLQIALTPSATPLATREALQQARDAGVSVLGISLDGSDAETHDAFRGWEGSFERTMRMLADARELELPVQVNTTVTRRNVHQIDAMAELFADQQIMMWSVFFLVPVGRGTMEERISAAEYEDVFEKLWTQSQRQPYGIKTTEAPHYRRFVMERGGDPFASSHPGRRRRAPLGVGDSACSGMRNVSKESNSLPRDIRVWNWPATPITASVFRIAFAADSKRPNACWQVDTRAGPRLGPKHVHRF
jgi:MoaA/NifB/PqqE/SkfB family radical SAM enzyme